MLTERIKEYAEENWGSFLKSLTEISKNHNSGDSLVYDENEIYSFDDISKALYPEQNEPASVDGLVIGDNYLELIEFKGGFKQKITKDSFDTEKGRCPFSGDVCKDYWSIFFENQKRKIRELVVSIKFKALESYITMEKQVFPRCSFEERKALKVVLTVVIDETGVDSMEDTLSELAAKNSEDNCYDSIRKALSGLKNREDYTRTPYYYNQINVISVQDFMNRSTT